MAQRILALGIKPLIELTQKRSDRMRDAPTVRRGVIVLDKLRGDRVAGLLTLVAATDAIGNADYGAFERQLILPLRVFNNKGILIFSANTSERCTAEGDPLE